MINVEVNQIPKSVYILIPIADQNMPSDGSIGIRIVHKQTFFKVFDHFVFKKGEMYPKGLMLLALGKKVPEEAIWKKYSESKKIFIFICKEMTEEEKEQHVDEIKEIKSEKRDKKESENKNSPKMFD